MPASPRISSPNAHLYAFYATAFTAVYTLCVLVGNIGHSLANGYPLADPGLIINSVLMLILGGPYPWVAYAPLFSVRLSLQALPEEKRVPLAFLYHAAMAGLALLLLWLMLTSMSAHSAHDAEVAEQWKLILIPCTIIAHIVCFSLAAFNYPKAQA